METHVGVNDRRKHDLLQFLLRGEVAFPKNVTVGRRNDVREHLAMELLQDGRFSPNQRQFVVFLDLELIVFAGWLVLR